MGGQGNSSIMPRKILPDHGKHTWGRGIFNRTEEDIIIMKSSKNLKTAHQLQG